MHNVGAKRATQICRWPQNTTQHLFAHAPENRHRIDEVTIGQHFEGSPESVLDSVEAQGSAHLLVLPSPHGGVVWRAKKCEALLLLTFGLRIGRICDYQVPVSAYTSAGKDIGRTWNLHLLSSTDTHRACTHATYTFILLDGMQNGAAERRVSE